MATIPDLLYAFVEEAIARHGGPDKRGSMRAAARDFGIPTSSLSGILRRRGRSITIGHLDHLRERWGWSVDDMLLALLRLNAELRVREPNAPFVPLDIANAHGLIRREYAEPEPANDNADAEPAKRVAGD